MKRKFVTNLAFLLFLNLLIKPFWVFGIDRTVQNIVGNSVYGWYYALFNLSLIFNILLDLGITTFNNRAVAQDHSRPGHYLVPLSGLKLMLAFVYAAIVLLTGLLLGYQQLDFRLLFILILNQFLASFILYLRSNISGLQHFMTDSAISVMDRLLVIIFCGFLLWSPHAPAPFRIEWFVLSQTFAYSLTLAVCLILVVRRASPIHLRLDISFSLSLLKKSVPFALLFLLMALYTWIGPVMIRKMLGPEGDLQNGVYAHAFRLIDFLSMFGFLMSGLLLPMFTHMLHKKDDIAHLLKFAFILIFIPSVILSVSFIFHNRAIMDVLYHADADLSAGVFSILMLAYPAVSASYIFGTLLTANGSMKVLNILAGSMMLFSFILNILLVPEMKSAGAAVSYSCSQILSALLQGYLAYRIFGFRVNVKLIAKVFGFVLIFILSAWLIEHTGAHWYLRLGFEIAAGMMLAFAGKLFDLKEMFRLFREAVERK